MNISAEHSTGKPPDVKKSWTTDPERSNEIIRTIEPFEDVDGFPYERSEYWPDDARMFEDVRLAAGLKSFRLSPNVFGLSLIKRTILAAYAVGLIRTLTAQRLIDRTKSWEA